MTRQQANMQLLEILRSYLLSYPDIRFSQALCNLNFVNRYNLNSPLYSNGNVWLNEYYLEPQALLKRVKQQLERNNQ